MCIAYPPRNDDRVLRGASIRKLRDSTCQQNRRSEACPPLPSGRPEQDRPRRRPRFPNQAERLARQAKWAAVACVDAPRSAPVRP